MKIRLDFFKTDFNHWLTFFLIFFLNCFLVFMDYILRNYCILAASDIFLLFNMTNINLFTDVFVHLNALLRVHLGITLRLNFFIGLLFILWSLFNFNPWIFEISMRDCSWICQTADQQMIKRYRCENNVLNDVVSLRYIWLLTDNNESNGIGDPKERSYKHTKYCFTSSRLGH